MQSLNVEKEIHCVFFRSLLVLFMLITIGGCSFSSPSTGTSESASESYETSSIDDNSDEIEDGSAGLSVGGSLGVN